MRVKADLHIHSLYSDGKNSPSEIVHRAADIGLAVVSISDHNTFEGSVRAIRQVPRGALEVLVIPGAEVRTDRGDVLVYCEQPFETPYRLGELVDKAHENNCLVVPAHPFDLFRLGIGEYVYSVRGWDAIEVWNASSTKASNRRAVQAARELGLPGLANSDAHVVEQVGSAYTIIEVDDLGIQHVLESIRRGRVQPVFGHHGVKATFKWVEWSIERRIRDLLEGR
ncbi:MAG: CehA/McbA family metallohydrolase [Thermogladius sp.]